MIFKQGHEVGNLLVSSVQAGPSPHSNCAECCDFQHYTTCILGHFASASSLSPSQIKAASLIPQTDMYHRDLPCYTLVLLYLPNRPWADHGGWGEEKHQTTSFTGYSWCIYIYIYIWVRSQNCSCLVTWFYYQLIAKPGNNTAAVSWPDPYDITKHIFCHQVSFVNFNLKLIRGKKMEQNFQHTVDRVSLSTLIHWGWVMHICVSKLTIIVSDIGLSPC